MVNPVIQNSDTRELVVFNGLFRSANVTRGAAGTLLKGTLLAFDEVENEYLPMQLPGTTGTDDNVQAIMPGDLVFAGTETVIDQVLIGGEVHADLLVFFDGDDTLDTAVPGKDGNVRTELQNYGITVRDIQDDSILDNQ